MGSVTLDVMGQIIVMGFAHTVGTGLPSPPCSLDPPGPPFQVLVSAELRLFVAFILFVYVL